MCQFALPLLCFSKSPGTDIRTGVQCPLVTIAWCASGKVSLRSRPNSVVVDSTQTVPMIWLTVFAYRLTAAFFAHFLALSGTPNL